MKEIPATVLMICCLAVMPWSTCVTAADEATVSPVKDEETKAMLEFYRKQSVWTEPGKYSAMYEGIPDEVTNVVQAVQNVLVHGGLLWLYKMTPAEQQGGGMNIRRVEEMLRRIANMKPGSLADTRSPDQRLVVNCRQFAVLTCSILRSKGISARARAGYALYTWGRGKYDNHWICEYWHPAKRRWVQVDAQIDSAQRKLMGIAFDTLDMPAGHFVPAGEGWQLFRQGKVSAEVFGLGGKTGWNGIGWGMVMPNVVCDTMALNKDELLPWDEPPYWAKKQAEMSAGDMDLIDKLSSASWNEIRSLYGANDTLHMPADFEKQKAE